MDQIGGRIQRVSIDILLDHVLPRVGCEIQTIKVKLDRKGSFVGERWAVFPEDPRRTGWNESISFKPLEIITQDIVECAESLGLVQRHKQR
jgi:hypothetical protein